MIIAAMMTIVTTRHADAQGWWPARLWPSALALAQMCKGSA
jgi:hypothetical protein